MKNINISKKLIALLSATTIALTSSGCFEKENNDNNKSSSDTTISSISSDLSKEELVSSSIAKPEITESSIASIESEISTSSKNNISSTSSKNNTNSSNISSKTNNSSKNNTTSNKTESTSSKSSTSSKESTSSNIWNIKELTKDNINDPEVFDYISYELCLEGTGAVLMFYNYTYNGETYRTNGSQEFLFYSTILNYKYLETSTLKALFNDCTLDDLQRYAYFATYYVPYIQSENNHIYNFENYCLDKNVGKLFYKFNDASINNKNNIESLFEEYFVNRDAAYHYGNTNAGIDYLLHNLSYTNKDSMANADNKDAVVQLRKTIQSNYDNFVLEIYNRINTKEKLLQLTN